MFSDDFGEVVAELILLTFPLWYKNVENGVGDGQDGPGETCLSLSQYPSLVPRRWPGDLPPTPDVASVIWIGSLSLREPISLEDI